MKVKIIYTATVEKEIEVNDVYEIVKREDCPQEIFDLFCDKMADIARDQEGFRDMDRVFAFDKEKNSYVCIITW